MRSQPKLHLPQLKLPLLHESAAVLPADKDEELVHALVELLLAAAGNPDPAARGGHHEPEVDL